MVIDRIETFLETNKPGLWAAGLFSAFALVLTGTLAVRQMQQQPGGETEAALESDAVDSSTTSVDNSEQSTDLGTGADTTNRASGSSDEADPDLTVTNATDSTDVPTSDTNPAAPATQPTVAQPGAPQPPTPEPVTPEPVTPEPVTPEPVTPEPVTPEPVTPEPVTPEPVTPEPVTPEPVTPEPPTLTSPPVGEFPDPIKCDTGTRQAFSFTKQGGTKNGDGRNVWNCPTIDFRQSATAENVDDLFYLHFERCWADSIEVDYLGNGAGVDHTVRGEDGTCINSVTPTFAYGEDGAATVRITASRSGGDFAYYMAGHPE